jgi:hypothetical protein
MIIKYKQESLNRREMAKFVSRCMGGIFDPYMANDGDDSFWIIDQGNN